MTYYRFHGSPRMYYSSYDDDVLAHLAGKLLEGGDAWCIFDNTASGAGASDALRLLTVIARLGGKKPRSEPRATASKELS